MPDKDFADEVYKEYPSDIDGSRTRECFVTKITIDDTDDECESYLHGDVYDICHIKKRT